MARELTARAAAEAAMLRPWAWGEADCCTAACSAFAALHGVDPMAPLRGRYADEAGARAAVAARGGWDVMTAGLAQAAGLTEIAPEAAPAGAIGLAVRAGERSLVLAVGDGLWAGKTLRGLALFRDGVVRAWVAPC